MGNTKDNQSLLSPDDMTKIVRAWMRDNYGLWASLQAHQDEDIVQEGCLALIRALPRYDEARSKLGLFCYSVLRNYFLSKQKRNRTRLSSLGAKEILSPEDTSVEDKDTLESVLKSLSNKQRAILELGEGKQYNTLVRKLRKKYARKNDDPRKE